MSGMHSHGFDSGFSVHLAQERYLILMRRASFVAKSHNTKPLRRPIFDPSFGPSSFWAWPLYSMVLPNAAFFRFDCRGPPAQIPSDFLRPVLSSRLFL